MVLQLELLMEEIIMTTAEVARKLNVTQTTISVWINSGFFPNAFKLSPKPKSPWRIPKSDVDAFIEKRRQQRGFFYTVN